MEPVQDEIIETIVYENITADAINNISGIQFFNIVHFNIRSLRKNFDELLLYIGSLQVSNIDIIVLSETWKLEEVNNFCIPNYNIYYNDSQFNQNDGVVVYVKNNIDNLLNVIHFSETKLIRLLFTVNNISFALTASYRPPSTNLQLYMTELEDYFLNKKENIEIFMGDINVNILNNLEVDVNNYICTLAELGFFSYVTKPTREAENTSSLIDHIFIRVNNKNLLKQISFQSYIFETNITDHYTLLLSANIINNPKKVNKTNRIKSKTINYAKLNNKLSTENWHEVTQINDPEIAYNIFINKLSHYINLNSVEVVHKNNKTIKLKPWITQGLLKSIRQRDLLKNKLKKNYSDELKTRYKQYRNSLNNLIKKTKNDYYKNKISSAQKNYKKIWQVINNATNNNSNKQDDRNPNIVDKNGAPIQNDKMKADFFNSFFANIGKEMASLITNITPMPELTNSAVNESIFLYPVTRNELIVFISSLKNDTSPGPDGVTVNTIKKIHEHIINPLIHIINACFIKGYIPKKWKESITTPIYKSGDKKMVTNYRPITVINNFAKIFEKCLKQRLVAFLEKHNILTKSQFGFREKLSTEDAVIEAINNIVSGLNDNKKCLAVFLDLAKAFDTVNHKILLKRLEKVGIRGLALNIFQDYLTDRIQRVKIVDSLSEPLPITMGVPQGTVLGPILFLVYINNLSQLKNIKGRVISYADDTVVIFEGKSWDTVYQDAESDLHVIQNWLNDSLLSLNVSKSKFITFSTNVKEQPLKSVITIHTSPCKKNVNCGCPNINQTYSIKYLGVIVDQHLRWADHVKYLTNRLRRLIFKFYQAREILNKNNLLMMYDALAESIMRYCIIIWGGLYKTLLHNLEVIQNTIIKIIFKKERRYSTELLFKNTGLLSIRKLYIYQCLLWMFKTPTSYRNHIYGTRAITNQSANVPFCKKSHTQRFVFYLAPKLYNMLPVEIKYITNKGKLKEELKNYVNQNFTNMKSIFD